MGVSYERGTPVQEEILDEQDKDALGEHSTRKEEKEKTASQVSSLVLDG